jgi:hypothetical protein
MYGIAGNAEATTELNAQEDDLPIHLEAGALAQDPSNAGALYGAYALLRSVAQRR